MAQKLNELALGYSLAIISAACMLLLSIGAYLGFYNSFAVMMMQIHMFYSLSVFGILAGMIEAAVWGFIAGYAIALVYNKLV